MLWGTYKIANKYTGAKMISLILPEETTKENFSNILKLLKIKRAEVIITLEAIH